jgi:hypothetical protein
MATDNPTRADLSLGVSPVQGTREWILAATVYGLLVVEGYREGGFWPADALAVALAALVVLAIAIKLVPLDRRSLLLVASVLALAVWWLVRACTAETARAFLPLGASMLGFAAAFVAVRPLVGRARELAGLGVACLGAAGALIGFAGLVWRWYPMAIPTQTLWRISSTLTYSDAAGLVLGMCLLVSLGVTLCPPLTRVTVCLCAGGLLATQSRGAYIAFLVAILIVPWRRSVRMAVPLAAGVALGVAAVASSPDTTTVPWLAGVVVIACVVAAFCSWDPASYRGPLFVWVGILALLAALVAAALAGLHHEIGVRALAPSDQDRSAEWSAALHQWESAPVVGVGPDRLLVFHAADGTYAHFAHNEYLQVAADGGAVGLALFLLVIGLATRVIRRFDLLSSCATSALVCAAVAGAFDFDWHLSFVGLLAGWCCGLAAMKGGQS